MFVRSTYWMWTSGSFTVTLSFGLDPARRYVMTGGLVGKSGGDYGQVYISTVCTQSGDVVLCGVRDDPADSPASNISRLGVVEELQSANRVTVKLRGDGGHQRAEGAIYDVT
jgi:hypothetical protein